MRQRSTLASWRLLLRALILVPLECGAGRPNARDVHAPIAVKVTCRARGRGHGSVESLLCPLLTRSVLGVIDGYDARAAATPGDHLVVAIPVEVGGQYGVPVDQGIVDRLTRPVRAVTPVDRHLVAMPRFDSRQEPLP